MGTMLLPPWQSPKSISIDVLSTHNTCLCPSNFFSPRSYNFVFCVPEPVWVPVPVPVKYGNDDDEEEEEEEELDDEHEHHHEDKDDRKYTKWFTISIHADGPCEVYTEEEPLTSFLDAKLHVVKGFAALGSHVYAFGGGLAIPFCPSDVCKLDVTGRGAYGCDSVPSMITPKFLSHNLVLDGKIYVFSARGPRDMPWGEVFDPDNGKWEACLFHLEKQRFCLLQSLSRRITPDGNRPSDTDLYCVVVNVSHMPGENRLGISLAWKQMFKVDCPYPFSDCLLLPEIKQEELRGANY